MNDFSARVLLRIRIEHVRILGGLFNSRHVSALLL